MQWHRSAIHFPLTPSHCFDYRADSTADGNTLLCYGHSLRHHLKRLLAELSGGTRGICRWLDVPGDPFCGTHTSAALVLQASLFSNSLTSETKTPRPEDQGPHFIPIWSFSWLARTCCRHEASGRKDGAWWPLLWSSSVAPRSNWLHTFSAVVASPGKKMSGSQKSPFLTGTGVSRCLWSPGMVGTNGCFSISWSIWWPPWNTFLVLCRPSLLQTSDPQFPDTSAPSHWQLTRAPRQLVTCSALPAFSPAILSPLWMRSCAAGGPMPSVLCGPHLVQGKHLLKKIFLNCLLN